MKILLKGLVPLIIFAIALLLLWNGLIDAEQTSVEQDVKRVRDSIRKAAVECYSVEGRYPTSLQTLQDDYGLLLDEDAYFVSYHFEADNMMPEIYVYRKGDMNE